MASCASDDIVADVKIINPTITASETNITAQSDESSTTTTKQQQQVQTSVLASSLTNTEVIATKEAKPITQPNEQKSNFLPVDSMVKNRDNDQQADKSLGDDSSVTIQPFGALSNTAKSRLNELRKILRHTESLVELPKFGIETENEKELSELMEQVDVWGLNIFEVHRISQEHSLTVVMYKIFEVR